MAHANSVDQKYVYFIKGKEGPIKTAGL